MRIFFVGLWIVFVLWLTINQIDLIWTRSGYAHETLAMYMPILPLIAVYGITVLVGWHIWKDEIDLND